MLYPGRSADYIGKQYVDIILLEYPMLSLRRVTKYTRNRQNLLFLGNAIKKFVEQKLCVFLVSMKSWRMCEAANKSGFVYLLL